MHPKTERKIVKSLVLVLTLWVVRVLLDDDGTRVAHIRDEKVSAVSE